MLAIFGSAALGGYQATQTFVRPVFIFMLAMQVLLVPGLTRRLVDRGAQDLMREARRLAIWIGIVAVALVIPVVVAARPLTRVVLGPAYVRYSGFLLPFAVASVLVACAVLPNAALRALQRGKRIFMVQLAASGVAFVAVLTAAWVSTVYVAVWATIAFGLVSAVLAWIALATAQGVRDQSTNSFTEWKDSPEGLLFRLTRFAERPKANRSPGQVERSPAQCTHEETEAKMQRSGVAG
jgi:O-antigen/teichoic acid export membrane protein